MFGKDIRAKRDLHKISGVKLFLIDDKPKRIEQNKDGAEDGTILFFGMVATTRRPLAWALCCSNTEGKVGQESGLLEHQPEDEVGTIVQIGVWLYRAEPVVDGIPEDNDAVFDGGCFPRSAEASETDERRVDG